ncbi:MAG: hypothetical protein GXY52_01560 [Chloroflexi bacterium]|nr:hypothetical protein [Chloroflexota bacterium]
MSDYVPVPIHLPLELSCKAFTYRINSLGQNLAFIDTASGIDYLDHQRATYCASLLLGGIDYQPSQVALQGSSLVITFGASERQVTLQLGQHESYLTLRVLRAPAETERLQFCNIPLKLKGNVAEPFGACAYALNLFTQVTELPTVQHHLQAACYRQFGVEGAEIALIAGEPKALLPVFRQAAAAASDLISLRNAGAWAQGVPFNHGSFLFNFGTLTEETVDEWIATVKQLGFNQIDNHGGTKFFKFGSLELNRDKWPEGWTTYKRIVKKLHDAGIDSILHTYSFFVDRESEFVTPVPSPYLDAFRTFTLSQPVGADDTTIYVNEPTTGMNTITGFMEANSIYLHIGDEMVTFGGVTQEAPYAFTDCTRGALGTQAAAHAGGVLAKHIKEYYGGFLPICDSPLFEEIARRHAEVADNCEFDGFYFDAIDAAHLFEGKEFGWYWGQRFVYRVYAHLKRRVSMEMSAMWHQMWNLRSRYRAWDFPVRGYKRFLDIHLEEITASLQLPLHLGWWNFHTAKYPQIEVHGMDVMDYLGCKMVGHNAGLAINTAVSQEALQATPLYGKLVERLRFYEDLRHAGKVPESVRARLREPGKEFIIRQNEGAAQFYPAERALHKVTDGEPWSTSWTFANPYPEQPLQLEIEALMAVDRKSGGITLENWQTPDQAAVAAADGMTLAIQPAGEATPDGTAAVCLDARNRGVSEANAAWARYERLYDPWLDLSERQALGVWVQGDGSGTLLNLRLETPHHIAMGAIAEHYVDIDFTGWRFVVLAEVDSGRWSDYRWGDRSNYYSAYRETIDFGVISRLSVWVNGIEPGKSAAIGLGPITALPLVEAEIHEPHLQLNDVGVTLPVTLASGDLLALDADGHITVTDWLGADKQQVQLESPLIAANGSNQVSLRAQTTQAQTARAKVTCITMGEQLV